MTGAASKGQSCGNSGSRTLLSGLSNQHLYHFGLVPIEPGSSFVSDSFVPWLLVLVYYSSKRLSNFSFKSRA